MQPEEAQVIRADISGLKQDIAGIKKLIETEGARCPYREDIARGVNNRRDIERNAANIAMCQEAATNARIGNAKLMGMLVGSGGVGGVIVAIANALARGS